MGLIGRVSERLFGGADQSEAAAAPAMPVDAARSLPVQAFGSSFSGLDDPYLMPVLRGAADLLGRKLGVLRADDESAAVALVGLEPRGRQPVVVRRRDDGRCVWVGHRAQAEHLEIESDAVVLRHSRRALVGEKAVEVSRSVFRADRYTLWVQLRQD